MKTNKTAHIIGSLCRSLLGITFIFSGFVKCVDPLGTVYKIEDYLMAFGGWFTDLMPLAGTAAVALIALEWTLGVCMLFNVRTSITAWLSLVFYLVMTPLTLWIALTNPVSDCGCFGDAIVLTNWQTFWKNVVLFILVIVLLGCKKYIPQLLSWWGELVVLLLALGASATIMAYSYTHLPPMDFRPYKVGNHIPTLMEVPEGAPVDEYAITLIYEKDGIEQEFTLENYPKGDSTWTFVDQQSVLIKKGYEPPIHDFEILTMNFEDITYDILESEEPITLITMYDLDKTNRTQAAKLTGIYHACMERGEQCYFLTGSGEEQIYAFGEEIGMDIETIESAFCTIDPVTLKTIVRANPGMFVVQNGTIMEKHNLRQMNE